ncbi:MAG: cupredoxin domain-containing protein [Pseudomonadota bacterium]|nr:MAG: cupredoxin domain-containing protein [Pseudomonadota bacterium]
MILTNLTGLLAIGFIVWWFWLSTPRLEHVAGDVIDIMVADGVYAPARIEVAAGRPVRLRFLRQDATPCAEKVLFDDLGVAADLALNETTEVTLTPPAGEHEFTCQMSMYRGRLIAR